MANTNAPTHDFAPPWLKIPSYDSPKPSGADSSDHNSSSISSSGFTNHKESHSYTSSRHTKESDNFSSRHPPYHDSRRERNAFSGDRKHSYLSSYHHSIDFEDPYFEGNGYHNNSYPNASCNGTSNSHVSLRRPHSRHDFRNGPSYGKGDLFNNHMKSNGGYHNNRAKSKFSEPSANSNSIFSENASGISVTSNNFNQEFPSLQGDISEEPVSTPVNGSVWEKPRNSKVHGSGVSRKVQLVNKASTIDSTTDNSKRSILGSSSSLSGSVLSSSGGGGPALSSNSHTVIAPPVAKTSSGTYRPLVPAKTTSTKKQQMCKDGSSAKVSFITKKPSLSSPAPTNHAMEILVKHPKACGNKSEFLKALRNENQKEAQENNSKNAPTNKGELCSKEREDKPHSNGIDIEKLNISNDNEKPLLSSSLEAEQRLLREMGWKEEASDDDNYAPLTEDEMREFKALSEQMVKKNGFRRNLQTNFSPRRLAPYSSPSAVVPLPADEACTSSSSESDSDF